MADLGQMLISDVRPEVYRNQTRQLVEIYRDRLVSCLLEQGRGEEEAKEIEYDVVVFDLPREPPPPPPSLRIRVKHPPPSPTTNKTPYPLIAMDSYKQTNGTGTTPQYQQTGQQHQQSEQQQQQQERVSFPHPPQPNLATTSFTYTSNYHPSLDVTKERVNASSSSVSNDDEAASMLRAFSAASTQQQQTPQVPTDDPPRSDVNVGFRQRRDQEFSFTDLDTSNDDDDDLISIDGEDYGEDLSLDDIQTPPEQEEQEHEEARSDAELTPSKPMLLFSSLTSIVEQDAIDYRKDDDDDDEDDVYEQQERHFRYVAERHVQVEEEEEERYAREEDDDVADYQESSEDDDEEQDQEEHVRATSEEEEEEKYGRDAEDHDQVDYHESDDEEEDEHEVEEEAVRVAFPRDMHEEEVSVDCRGHYVEEEEEEEEVDYVEDGEDDAEEEHSEEPSRDDVDQGRSSVSSDRFRDDASTTSSTSSHGPKLSLSEVVSALRDIVDSPPLSPDSDDEDGDDESEDLPSVFATPRGDHPFSFPPTTPPRRLSSGHEQSLVGTPTSPRTPTLGVRSADSPKNVVSPYTKRLLQEFTNENPQFGELPVRARDLMGLVAKLDRTMVTETPETKATPSDLKVNTNIASSTPASAVEENGLFDLPRSSPILDATANSTMNKPRRFIRRFGSKTPSSASSSSSLNVLASSDFAGAELTSEPSEYSSGYDDGASDAV
ncbi:hypothetical protein HK102_006998, partial [Quaeritorhiza haematococci]